jgi:hypothetical protein
MKQLVFVKPAAIRLDGNYVTDHNRSPLSVSYERFESNVRTQNGTLRRYFRAVKHSFSCSWEQVPETSDDTVDGRWGVAELESFMQQNPGAFELELTFNAPQPQTDPLDPEGPPILVPVVELYTVVFASFEKSLLTRKQSNLYSMSIDLEEV